MEEVFLHKADIPRSCADCPFSKKKYGLFDNPIICCITENIIRKTTDDKSVQENRHSTCPIKTLNESELKPKYKKCDTVYYIDYVGYHHPQKGGYLYKDAVECKIKAVHIGKTKVSYSLDRHKQRIDERRLFATRAEALEIINRGK